MGQPNSTASSGRGQEILRYNLSDTGSDPFTPITNEYYVRMINGKVYNYGRMGDFDSTKDPSLDININADD